MVWLPSIIINLYHTFLMNPGKDPYLLVELLVLLTSAQGILNSVVYIWGYRPFRWWIKEHLGLKHRTLYRDEDDDTESLVTTYAVLNEKVSCIRPVMNRSEYQSLGYNGARIESGERAVRFGRGNDVRVISVQESYESDPTEHDDISRRGRMSSQKSTSSWRERLPSWVRRSSVG